MSRLLSALLVGLIRGYQLVLSPWMGPACRFEPTCSEYAVEAVRIWGPLRGSALAVQRLLRCHPLGGHGLDPVPSAAEVSVVSDGS